MNKIKPDVCNPLDNYKLVRKVIVAYGQGYFQYNVFKVLLYGYKEGKVAYSVCSVHKTGTLDLNKKSLESFLVELDQLKKKMIVDKLKQ